MVEVHVGQNHIIDIVGRQSFAPEFPAQGVMPAAKTIDLQPVADRFNLGHAAIDQ